jgi:hypothetical protein
LPLPLTHDNVHLYSSGTQAKKLLRHHANLSPMPRYCPEGQRLEGSDIVSMQSGWEYSHGPFACRAIPRVVSLAEVGVGRGHSSNAALLAAGWGALEDEGVWTQGRANQLIVDVPMYRGELVLRLNGNYFGDQRSSQVDVNGKPLGRIDLSKDALRFPADSVHAGRRIVIDLVHEKASSPASRGESGDTRQLAFFLRSVQLQAISR